MRTSLRHKLPKPRRQPIRKPKLRVSLILQWADTHRSRTGKWPTADSGTITDAPWDTWRAVNGALIDGYRGLRPGSTLAAFLHKHRRKRLRYAPPKLTVAQIVRWADAFHSRTGRWPRDDDGPIPEAPGESWGVIQRALQAGKRGLPRGMTLPKLIARHRKTRNVGELPVLSIERVLRLVDAHRRRTGTWPKPESGLIPGTRGQTWRGINSALRHGRRGLPSGYTLPRFIAEHRGVRNRARLPRLTEDQIIRWADAWHARRGMWPTTKAGAIPDAPGENWGAVNLALARGTRGLPGGSSLARLLARRRGRRNKAAQEPLTFACIRRWARDHLRRAGQWPTVRSGPVIAAPGETWLRVDGALRDGYRGLPGGSSLRRVLPRT